MMRPDEMYEHFRCPECDYTWQVYAPHANDPHTPVPTIRQLCEECAQEAEEQEEEGETV
jgi:hypothetical protein